jgi:hypothetical protein
MAWEGVNRRGFPRVNYPCVVKIRRKGSAEAFHTKTENIGCGGVCVILPKNIGLFSPAEMEVDLENGQGRIVCDGTVVWVVRRSEINKDSPNFFDTGIEFVNLKEEDSARIDKIVKECLQKDAS